MPLDPGLTALRPRRTLYAPMQSLQFEAANGDYLTRTPAVATPDRTRGILVVAMKPARALLPSTLERLFFVNTASIMRGGGEADGRGYFSFGYGGYYRYSTTSFHRDPTAFTLLVCSYDTNAPAGERVWWYNGLTRLPAPAGTEFGTGEALPFGTTVPHYIGYDGTYNFDGVLSDVRWLAGMSLQNGDHAPEDFFEDDGFGGVNLVRPATAGYGVNGFWLDGEIAGGLALDKSGNGNHFTASGVTECLDSPGDKASADVGNYARLSDINKGAPATVSKAGLTLSISGADQVYGRATMPVGPGMKVYFEVDCVDQAEYRYISCGAIYDGRTGTVDGGTGGGGAFPTWGSGAQLAIAADHDAGTVAFYRSGALVTTVTGVAHVAPWVIQLSIGGTSDPSGVFNVRFDPGTFVFAPPDGFTPLCTAYLPAKAPKNPRAQMGVVTYAGTSAPQTISSLGFRPDFIWIKERTIGEHHRIFDSVRGLGLKNKEIGTSLAYAEGINNSCAVTATDDGFSFSDGSSTWSPNFNTATYVAWCIGGLTHMTAPEIATLVTASGATITPSAIAYDATLGMAIIKYTGNGTAGTIPHPLGQAPGMIIAKLAGSAGSWHVGHKSLTSWGHHMWLDQTGGQSAHLGFNNTAPTPTVFSVAGVGYEINTSGVDTICYLFADTDTIKVGAYTGNGGTDGPFADLSGRPLWLMIKRTDGGSNWITYDTARDPFNACVRQLFPNSASAEYTTSGSVELDILASGFKPRVTDSALNAAGGSYIYLAFIDRYFGGGNVAQGRAR